MGSPQPGCPSSDGSDSHLHSNSYGHASAIANFTRTDGRAAYTDEYARPKTIFYASAIANSTTTNRAAAYTNGYH